MIINGSIGYANCDRAWNDLMGNSLVAESNRNAFNLDHALLLRLKCIQSSPNTQAHRSPSPSQMDPWRNPEDEEEDSLREIASKLVATAIEGATCIVEGQ